ncbi:MAG: orotidine-5'-phosphate decarboxylase, partial [Anaerolineae bacterium]|nr:orotidine-5'-phosphate decarboxylase [Anaerolineae bacterium]
MVKNFVEKLRTAIKQNNSLLCVGLDPDPMKFSDHFEGLSTDVESALTRWGRGIIEQTHDLGCCYKPNIAFYEQFGPPGLQALLNTVAAIPANVPILLDAKRGDIGSTAAAYARMAFEIVGADAVTVNPYLGQDSIAPFLEYPGKTVFVLCYTSNASAKQIQQFGPVGGLDLFEHIVQEAQSWGSAEQIAFVVGATQPEALARFRTLAPKHWVLAPGVGAQGGDLQQTLSSGLTPDQAGLIVPVSRGIIYAADPRTTAAELRT